jgi:hypothetical protein
MKVDKTVDVFDAGCNPISEVDGATWQSCEFKDWFRNSIVGSECAN